MNSKFWDVLYSKGSKGEIRVWTIRVEENKVIISHGVKDGKIVEKVTESFGKNKGRANETTDHEQALSEAEAKYVKQLKRGYFKSIQEAVESEDTTPMKLHNFKDQGHKIVYPCLAQIKLDGIRLKVDKHGNAVSKAGEVYYIPEHINKQVETLKRLAGEDKWKGLDGEIYAGNRNRGGLSLQAIVSAFRKPNENTPKLQYWVYDIPVAGETFLKRSEMLSDLQYIADEHNLDTLVFLPGNWVHGKEDLLGVFDDAVERKEEGIVARNQKGLYEFGKRSYDALKLKQRETTEAYVTGFTIDKNGEAVLLMEIENGGKPKGKALKDFTIDDVSVRTPEGAEKAVGSFVVLEYEDMSDDDVPLKPVVTGQRVVEIALDGQWIVKE